MQNHAWLLDSVTKPQNRHFSLVLKQIELIPFLGPLHTLSSLGQDASAPRSLHNWLLSNSLIIVQISPL